MARRKERKTLLDSALPEKQKNVNLEFDEAVDLFLTEVSLKGQSFDTQRWHRENLSALKKMLTLEEKDTKPSTISETTIKKHFILPMINKCLKVNTINGRIRSCHAFFSYLYAEGYISKDPAKHVGNLKKEKPLIETFTRSQVKKLLSVIDQGTFTGFRDYVLVLLFLEIGIRVSEAASLRIVDILFEEGSIRISRGKGAKGRMVPFQAKMKVLLQKYLKERGDVYHTYLFINRDEHPLKKRAIQERLTIYGKKAGIEGVRCSPHTLRHTMAKFYILSGGDIFSLQKILGHSSLDMVRRYVELFGSEVKEQHRKFSPLNDLY